MISKLMQSVVSSVNAGDDFEDGFQIPTGEMDDEYLSNSDDFEDGVQIPTGEMDDEYLSNTQRYPNGQASTGRTTPRTPKPIPRPPSGPVALPPTPGVNAGDDFEDGFQIPTGEMDDEYLSNTQRYPNGQASTGRTTPRTPKPIPRPPSGPVALPPPPGEPGPKGRSTIPTKTIGAIAVLCIAGFAGYQFLFGNSDRGVQSASSGGGAHSTGSDENQIRQLVQAWADDFNNQDLAGLQSLMCSGSAAQLPRNLFPRHDIKGTLSSSVSNINVAGNQATATVISNWSGGTHERWDNSYAKENGAWKICHTLSY